MDCLNLGCGYRFHPAWINVNFTSTAKGVIAHDLTKGIPFPEASFDVVYHSHILEHFPKTAAEAFIKECYRVLRPQGVLRVVVPDLEQIASTYLTAIDKASSGNEEWAANYEWILLELCDQMVRDRSGGEMKEYLFRENIPNEEFILKRYGIEAKNLIESARLKRQKPQQLWKHIYHIISKRHQIIMKSLLGKVYSAFQIGQFRQSGEIHLWMYDRYSLSVLLKNCGFSDMIKRSATESYIKNWAIFNLDTEADGMIYKPDSLYMEAIKLSTENLIH